MFGLKTLKRLALLVVICGFATATHSPDQSQSLYNLPWESTGPFAGGCPWPNGMCGIPPKVLSSTGSTTNN